MARRRLSGRAIKLHRNYTVDEVSRTLGVSKGTVRRWLKNGLDAITDQKPLLILGPDLIGYLNSRAVPKQKCRLHECRCFSCQKPRAPAFGAAEIISLTATSGNLRALCEVCSTVMHKRVSVANIEALSAILDLTIMQAKEPISEHDNPCLNDHLQKELEAHA